MEIDIKKIDKSENFIYSKGRTIIYMILTLFGVLFLFALGYFTKTFFGAGFIGAGVWFVWFVVFFVIVLAFVFSAIIVHWTKYGLSNGAVRSLYIYCLAILSVCAFTASLQAAVFGAFNYQVQDMGFVAFGNIFSIIWISAMSFVTGVWFYSSTSNNQLDEKRYKILRNYFMWTFALFLFLFHFEQVSTGVLGVDTERMLEKSELGDKITLTLTRWLEAGPDAIGAWVGETIGPWATTHQIEFTNFVSTILINQGGYEEGGMVYNRVMNQLDKAYDEGTVNVWISESVKGQLSKMYWGAGIHKPNEEFIDITGNEEEAVWFVIDMLYDKGEFWGLNNSWSGWLIFITVIGLFVGLTSYGTYSFVKNDSQNIDNQFWVLTPICIIIFTIFMYSINAYIVTFIADGTLNPGTVGSHIGHLQNKDFEVGINSTIIEIINAHWMFNIQQYVVSDLFAGSYNGTIWWWCEWVVSFIGLNAIITVISQKNKKQLASEFSLKQETKKLEWDNYYDQPKVNNNKEITKQKWDNFYNQFETNLKQKLSKNKSKVKKEKVKKEKVKEEKTNNV